MDNVGEVVFDDIDIIAPVPVHWSRLLRRRYNQAAELSKHIARIRLVDHIPDLLTRSKRTSMQVDMSREERIANQRSALTLTPRFSEAIKGKRVLLIDDVMTTGATMSACAEACLKAGSADVNALVFARVAQDY
jgi:ComF family protein